MVSIAVALAVCLAAYGFLAAYALKGMAAEQLAGQQMRLRIAAGEQRELTRQRNVLAQAEQFHQTAESLGLDRKQCGCDACLLEPST